MANIPVGIIGFWAGLAAGAATLAFDVVQLLQVAGVLTFPLDEALIYGTSLCIVVPLLVTMLALHHLTPSAHQFWSHGALVFSVIYAVFVSANYVVQLGTVLPAKLAGQLDGVRVLDQAPHSMFWYFDAVGYVALGLAALLAVPAFGKGAQERRTRQCLLAHAAVTPLIVAVYVLPGYSNALLMLGLPWAVTAPVFMLAVATSLRRRAGRADAIGARAPGSAGSASPSAIR